MARRSHSRRRFIAGGFGLALTAAAGGGILFLTPGLAGARVGSGAVEGSVIVCESGVVSHGGIDTSSAVAIRVPVGTAVPPGCRSG
jgi:hypothetical protein